MVNFESVYLLESAHKVCNIVKLKLHFVNTTSGLKDHNFCLENYKIRNM